MSKSLLLPTYTHTKTLLSRQRKLNKRQKEGVNGDLAGAKLSLSALVDLLISKEFQSHLGSMNLMANKQIHNSPFRILDPLRTPLNSSYVSEITFGPCWVFPFRGSSNGSSPKRGKVQID